MIMQRLVLTLALCGASALAQARDWTLDPAHSTLRFRATQQGEPFEGGFGRFNTTVAFDAAKPESIAIATEIDMASVSTENAERDSAIIMPEWFHIERFPKAQFRTLGCVARSASTYDCKAELTLRDKTQPLTFSFSWTEQTDGSTRLQASTKLNRLDYDVGGGDWADPESVGLDVEVLVDVRLTPSAK
jgi:polyisoprenoid-binding protein YceI